jgi:hypothetical protein
MNWGKWITVAFILFAVFIGVLVTICVKQDISLVATDYYKQELGFQQQIDRSNNVHQLINKPEILIVNNHVQISFKDFSSLQQGELKLFRPSNAKSDLVFQLKSTADTLQRFDLNSREKGMYKAKMKWSMNDKEYYMEKMIYL